MSLLKKKISSGNIKTKHFYYFKNYLGNQSSFRNKKFDEFLLGFDSASGSVYNLDRTVTLLKRTLNFLKLLKKEDKQLLIVGTSLKSQKLTKLIGESTSNPYVQRRWLKGLLTNWENISSSIKFFNLFLKKLSLTKKRESKLKETFDGLKSLDSLPDALLFVDLDSNSEVIREANKLNIPIIAIIDNNYKDIEKIDYPIISNTNSPLPLFLVVSLIINTLKN